MNKKSVMPFLAVLYGAGFVSAFNENLVSVALVDVMAEFGITESDLEAVDGVELA